MRPALVPLFVTGPEVVDLGPYVPSVNDRGDVAFTARHADGHTALWCLEADTPRCVVQTGEAGPLAGGRFSSHPDLDGRGRMSVYATLTDGRDGVVWVEADGGVVVRVSAGERFHAIAPMGPTMDEAGGIAFRAVDRSGAGGMYLSRPTGVAVLVDAAEGWTLDGLPVLNAGGTAVLRGDPPGASPAVWRVRDGVRAPVIEVGAGLVALGRFPMVADDGAVGVAAERREGGWTYLVDRGGARREVIGPGRVAFVRGGLLGTGGMLAVHVTPWGGAPAVWLGPDPEGDRWFALGDPFLGAEIVDYALNPVSGASSGWVVVRLGLSDGRQVIARAGERVRAW